MNGPFDLLSLGKVHSLCNGRGKVDIPLLTFLSLDKLYFRLKSHDAIPFSQR